MGSLIVGPQPADQAGSADSRPESRLFRFNDGVLIVLLLVPQVVWLGVVAYLLHLHV